MDIDDELLGLAEGTTTSKSRRSKSSKRKRPVEESSEYVFDTSCGCVGELASDPGADCAGSLAPCPPTPANVYCTSDLARRCASCTVPRRTGTMIRPPTWTCPRAIRTLPLLLPPRAALAPREAGLRVQPRSTTATTMRTRRFGRRTRTRTRSRGSTRTKRSARGECQGGLRPRSDQLQDGSDELMLD